MGAKASAISPVEEDTQLTAPQVLEKIKPLTQQELCAEIRDGSPWLAAAFEKLGLDGGTIAQGLKLVAEKEVLSSKQVIEDAKVGVVSMALRSQYALAAQAAETAVGPLVKKYEDQIKETQVALGRATDSRDREKLEATIKSLEAAHDDIKPSLEAARAAKAHLQEEAMVALLPQVGESMQKYDIAQDAILADPEQAAGSDEIAEICKEVISKIDAATAPKSQTLSAEAQKLFDGKAGENPSSLEYFAALLSDAERCKATLDPKIVAIAEKIDGATAELAPLKGAGRGLEKTTQDYAMEFPRLRDLARCSIKCSDTMTAKLVLQKVISSPEWTIIAVKDRMSRGFNSGQIGGSCRVSRRSPLLL